MRLADPSLQTRGMPAVVNSGNLLAWNDGGQFEAPVREREEHAYCWRRTTESECWIGEQRQPARPVGTCAPALPAELAHDLRHILTRAELEFEAGDPRRAREALAQARSLCEGLLELRPASALDLVALCSAEARAAARLHEGREVQTSLPRECRLACAESQLRRLLANLLGNALRASPAGEAVRFTLEGLADGGARFTVEDRGPGFEARAIDGLLASRASGSGSTGLGSLSVMDCARVLRASIEVSSAPDGGSMFVVRLPG